MRQFQSWKADLGVVLPQVRRVALGSSAIRMIALSDRVALGLPRSRTLAREVLRLYRPMKWKARLLVRLLDGALLTGVFRFLPPQKEEGGEPEISWLQGGCEIGFLGCNPTHGVRCVLLSHRAGEELRVTKVAIGGEFDAVIEEAVKLRELGGRYQGVVPFGGVEKGDGWVAFWARHIPGKGPQSVVGVGVIELLEGWLSSEWVSLGDLPWVANLLEDAPAEIADQLRVLEVRSALVHGDFAPWNLRRDGGGFVAIDWEGAREDGVGGLDLGHGLFAEAMLVKGLAGRELIEEVLMRAGGVTIMSYLKGCGWDDLNLWCGFSLLSVGAQSERPMAAEWTALKNRMEQLREI